MKIAVIQFPGSNCERETILAIQRAGMEAVEFLWNEPKEKLALMDGYVIIGGFSYEDRSRAGIIAALDPVMEEIKRQSEQGKPVLGLCNGAQILVETGMVPGLADYKPAMALTENKRVVDGKILGTGFYNNWIQLKAGQQVKNNAFTRYVAPEQVLTIPTAHAEGRFVMSQALLQEIEQKGLNCFQYCDEQGQVADYFPVNPNGSMGNIAAVCNHSGNVMAMMPHPERTPAGDAIFRSMHDYIEEGCQLNPQPLQYKPVRSQLLSYEKKEGSYESLVELVITDNHALTVQNTLHQLGIPVQVKRLVHWDIESPSDDNIDEIKKSALLFNERKEIERQPTDLMFNKDSTRCFLVRAKDNLIGQQKLQMLTDHFAIKGIEQIQHGTLWIFTSEKNDINTLADLILNTNIICNPYAYDCYRYESFI